MSSGSAGRNKKSKAFIALSDHCRPLRRKQASQTWHHHYLKSKTRDGIRSSPNRCGKAERSAARPVGHRLWTPRPFCNRYRPTGKKQSSGETMRSLVSGALLFLSCVLPHQKGGMRKTLQTRSFRSFSVKPFSLKTSSDRLVSRKYENTPRSMDSCSAKWTNEVRARRHDKPLSLWRSSEDISNSSDCMVHYKWNKGIFS